MNRSQVQAHVKTQYKNGEIKTIQEQSGKVYTYLRKNKISHLGALKELLDMGVKYEDILGGILIQGIDEGALF